MMTPEEVEDAADEIRASMAADDRQPSYQYDDASRRLTALQCLIEDLRAERDDLLQVVDAARKVRDGNVLSYDLDALDDALQAYDAAGGV